MNAPSRPPPPPLTLAVPLRLAPCEVVPEHADALLRTAVALGPTRHSAVVHLATALGVLGEAEALDVEEVVEVLRAAYRAAQPEGEEGPR